MADQNDDNRESGDMRGMLIMSVIIVLMIAGGMGLNVLFHKDTGPSEMSSQSRTAPVN